MIVAGLNSAKVPQTIRAGIVTLQAFTIFVLKRSFLSGPSPSINPNLLHTAGGPGAEDSTMEAPGVERSLRQIVSSKPV